MLAITSAIRMCVEDGWRERWEDESQGFEQY